MVSMIKRNAAVNADGFGVGWYNLEVDPEPCIFTSIAPAEHNVNLARLCKKIQSHLIFGHVRAASLGSPVNDTNCHPFQFGRYLWMHNGCVANWSAVKRPITALLSSCSYSYISGTTDSEIAGALFVDQLPSHNPHVEHSPQEIIDAMNRTIQILTQFVHALHIPGSGESLVSSLNFAVSDGKTVVATRFRDSPLEEPPSLYYCKVTHMEMVANEMEIHHDPKCGRKPKGVVIASEPLTYQSENWTLIPKNHMIVVTGESEVQLLPITVTSEMVNSKWISDAESATHASLHLGASDLNKFFGTACCASLHGSIKAGCSALATEIGVKLNASASISAPSSPPASNPAPVHHFSPNTKSAMILESPIMTGALRALLASATPAQLREILESNLLPASAPPCGGTSSAAANSLLANMPCGGLAAAAFSPSAASSYFSNATTANGITSPRTRIANGTTESNAAPVFDYATVAQSLSPSSSSSRLHPCSGGSTASTMAHHNASTTPTKTSPNGNANNSALPAFMRRGDSPAVLESDSAHAAGSGKFPLPVFPASGVGSKSPQQQGTSLRASFMATIPLTDPSSADSQTSSLHSSASNMTNGHGSLRASIGDVSFTSPGSSYSDLPIIPN